MSTEAAVPNLLAPLPSDLPPVERRAVMPAGFEAGGSTAGIKASGRPDLTIIRTTAGPAAAAAVFTTNALAAAPVRLSQAHLLATEPTGAGRFGWVDAIVSTSGSANAATGPAGDADQAAIAGALGRALRVPVERTLALSTGIIGTRLPVGKVVTEAVRLAESGGLRADGVGLEAAAVALRTTDSRTKVASVELKLPGPEGDPVPILVAGIAKGVGMIHPRMATMLAVILTDASVEPAVLHGLLSAATVRTWNQLTVDGDTSTNDSVIVLASGAGGAPVAAGLPAAADLGRAIEAVARDLARQQAADGEGATTLLTCQVSGAVDDADARSVARSVVSSSLVKAAVHGRDPNWGRIAAAAGNARLPDVAILASGGVAQAEARERAGSQARVEPDRLRIAIAGMLVFDGFAGGPLPFDPATVRAAMDAPELLVRVDLGLGPGTGEAFGCDLTEQYVVENSAYTT